MEAEEASKVENGNGADSNHSEANRSDHRRSLSGSILSKLSFLRPSADGYETDPAEKITLSPEYIPGEDRISSKKTNRAMAVAVQQQKTRRRKGSLRKAALLGRGAQREKKENGHESGDNGDGALSPISPEEMPPNSGFGLGIRDLPLPSLNGFGNRASNGLLSPIKTLPMGSENHLITSPTLTYTSTTDEDDILSIPSHNLPPPRVAPSSSGSDSYFPPGSGSLGHRRSSQKAKSPLSVAGMAVSPLPVPNEDWDYSETEKWGWAILIVTWLVFVTGMGSCLGVWSWAWDVGETPYAPPELENDETLPIVGYYPALIILTGVMAWVWVVVAWVGMKYFRHAKISSD